MRGGVFEAVIAALGMALAGCAATTTTSKVAVDYNRIFASARNEVLVTNILRAADREPLQFSTMGTVTGTVRNSGTIDLPIPSLIGKGATILSPEITVNEGINPNVSIIPLSSKEFTEGILRPVTLDEVSYFINQGWDPELVLELVVGGVICPNGAVVFNRGDFGDPHYEAFADMFAAADRSPIHSVGNPEPTVLRMAASEAVAVMKDGVGSGHSVAGIVPVKDKGQPTDQVEVTIVSSPTSEFTGLDIGRICNGAASSSHAAGPTEGLVTISSAAGKKLGSVVLRSPEAIIYFLGETQWWRWAAQPCCGTKLPPDWPYYWKSIPGAAPQPRALLRIDKTCRKTPVAFRTFVETHFNDCQYYVLRQEDAGKEDRSLSTLSLLDELIALQTSQSSIAAGAPIIAIGTK